MKQELKDLNDPASDTSLEVIRDTIYPGASIKSVAMVQAYCVARGLDPMMKPVHIVPMSVRDSETGQYSFRDVVLPGINLYRVQADRSGTYAGQDEPEFGNVICGNFKDKSGGNNDFHYPEFCKITVYKIVNEQRVPFVAKVYWLESYATENKNSQRPNSMWAKRPYGQLEKCAEAMALRKGWPEVGALPTVEEMEGKTLETELVEESKPSKIESINNMLMTLEKVETNFRNSQSIKELDEHAQQATQLSNEGDLDRAREIYKECRHALLEDVI